MSEIKTRNAELIFRCWELINKTLEKGYILEIRDKNGCPHFTTELFDKNIHSWSDEIDFKIQPTCLKSEYSEESLLFLELFNSLYQVLNQRG